MALLIKFAKTDIAKKAASITFADTTGVYDGGSNQGGYGTPNFPAPTQGWFRWRYWTDDDPTDIYLSNDDMTSLLTTGFSGSGLTMTPALAGIPDQSSRFLDGIHQIQYIPLKDTGVTATFTNGSTQVVLTTNDFDASVWGSTVAMFVTGVDTGDADTQKTGVLELDWDETNDDVQLTLTEAYTGDTGTYQLYYGPMVDLKVLVNKAAEECIVKMIGSVAATDCVCTAQRALINQYIQWRFAADVQFDCDDFDGAHNLVNEINKYCRSAQCTIC